MVGIHPSPNPLPLGERRKVRGSFEYWTIGVCLGFVIYLLEFKILKLLLME